MTSKTCGCSTASCGCCEGTEKLTPASVINRPGLDVLHYRVGTHGAFLETMKARLATMNVDAPGADGQTPEKFYPLRGLTTLDSRDPAIALLDGWACVGDVLSFYQERIADEGYLRTATERRSVLELARLVGYALRPGVAATVYLAYTLDDKQVDPVEIPIGARAQSIPGPDELPQSFETSDKLLARSAWNNLQVRLHRPQSITLDDALVLDNIYVSGTTTNLKAGDQILFVFDETGDQSIMRVVAAIEADFDHQRTKILFQGLPRDALAARPALDRFVEAVASTGAIPNEVAHDAADTIRRNILLGAPLPPKKWIPTIIADFDVAPDDVKALLKFFDADIAILLGEPPPVPPSITDPSKFIAPLLKPPVLQAASSLRLPRSLAVAFKKGADVHPQLLVNFAPQLKDTYYAAWANADVNPTVPVLKAYALRVSAPLFGATVPKQVTYYTEEESTADHRVGQLKLQSDWEDWGLQHEDETNDSLFLDHAHEAIVLDSYVVVQTAKTHMQGAPTYDRRVQRVQSAQTIQRTAYGVSGQTTRLTLAADWRTVRDGAKLTELRPTLVYGQSEEIPLADEPITTDVDGEEIELAGLYNELTSGRWIICSGERADIEGVSGVKVSELLMISGLKHGYNRKLPGDKTHTTLLLATNTAYTYKRESLTIYGNVVKATHGETRNETLGSGDGSQALQAFGLKQPPLTFVASATPAGAESTLKIYVNDVEWHETETLAGLKPTDRRFVTKADDEAKTAVIFGNGEQGARLPTGVENLKAVYRQGIGKGGNVRAEQISLLQSRPLGVKGVINPLRASGGADKESRDLARENAPLAVMALDRLVSVQDYADFTRTFAGIAKADARTLSDGQRELVHLTIAGADDIPIDPTADLYRNLVAALHQFGESTLALQVDPRELVVLVVNANVRLAPDYLWEPVATEIRAALFESFGFQKRALSQPAFLGEIISLIHKSKGVAYVDVDAFGGIPEKKLDVGGTRRLLTLEESTVAVQMIVDPTRLLRTAYLKGVGEFLRRVGDTDDPVSTFLMTQFSDDIVKAIQKGDAADLQSGVLQDSVVSELNTIIIGKSIYTPGRFAPGRLSEETLQLSEQELEGQALMSFNRLLLQEAYPGELGPKPGATQKPVRPGPAQSVEVNVAGFEGRSLRPAQLAIFTAAVPDTVILNEIK